MSDVARIKIARIKLVHGKKPLPPIQFLHVCENGEWAQAQFTQYATEHYVNTARVFEAYSRTV